MSTTIKRVALVAVAALGLGVLSVAPSQAAVQADTLSLSSATASTTVGTAVTTDVTVSFIQETTSDSMTVALTYDAAPAGIAINEVTFTATAAVVDTDLGSPVVDTTTANSRLAKISTTAAASVRKTMKITLTPSKAGTYVIRATPAIVGGATPVSTAKTWTVTVAPKTLGWNTAFIGVYTNGTSDTATADATAANLKFASTASTGAKARIDVGQGYGTVAGAANETATAADAKDVVVTTTKGLVSKTNDYTTAAKSVTEAAATDPDADFYVFANGDVGAASITITVGGVLVATKTVTFTGPAKALVATLKTGEAEWIKVGGNSKTKLEQQLQTQQV